MVEAARDSSVSREEMLSFTRDILLEVIKDIEISHQERVSSTYLGEETVEQL